MEMDSRFSSPHCTAEPIQLSSPFSARQKGGSAVSILKRLRRYWDKQWNENIHIIAGLLLLGILALAVLMHAGGLAYAEAST